jgi:hypothetical protein
VRSVSLVTCLCTSACVQLEHRGGNFEWKQREVLRLVKEGRHTHFLLKVKGGGWCDLGIGLCVCGCGCEGVDGWETSEEQWWLDIHADVHKPVVVAVVIMLLVACCIHSSLQDGCHADMVIIDEAQVRGQHGCTHTWLLLSHACMRHVHTRSRTLRPAMSHVHIWTPAHPPQHAHDTHTRTHTQDLRGPDMQIISGLLSAAPWVGGLIVGGTYVRYVVRA